MVADGGVSMASIVIGGEQAQGHLDTFYLLERAWPHIKAVEEASQAGEQMAAMGEMIAVVAVAVAEARPDLADPTAIKKKLRKSEIAGLGPGSTHLLRDAGATGDGSRQGEAQPEKGEASPSTAISPP